MTSAEIKILKAVRAGKCERHYNAKGNTMHGAAGAVLHRLADAGFIRDGADITRGYIAKARLVLTDKGHKALDESLEAP